MTKKEKTYCKKMLELSKVKRIRDKIIELWGKAAIQFETYRIGEYGRGDEFSSFDAFWNACRTKQTDEIDIDITANDRSVGISSSFSQSLSVTIESPDDDDIDILFHIVEENLGLQEKVQFDMAKSIKYFRTFRGRDLYNYGTLLEIRNCLMEKWQMTKGLEESYVVDWGYETWDYFESQSFLVATHRNQREIRSVRVSWSEEEFMRSLALELGKISSSITISDFSEESINEIASYVEEKLSLMKQKILIERSAFIAHRFDKKGREISELIQKCLEALGFNVITGEGFSPQSISKKVKERINRQSIFVTIHSKPESAFGHEISQWLIEETTFALEKEKLVFQFVEEGLELKQGLRGDLEEIRFSMNDLSTPIIKLIAGIKERYLI